MRLLPVILFTPLLVLAMPVYAQEPTPTVLATPTPAPSPAVATTAAGSSISGAAGGGSTAGQAAVVTTAGAVAVVSPQPTPTPVYSAAGSIEGGAAATTGNTNVQTYTGAIKADAKGNGWMLTLRGAGIWAESNNVQSAGAWGASLRVDRKLFSIFGAYLKVGMDGDPFNGINNNKIAGAGFTATWAARDPGAKFDRDAVRAEAGYQYDQENLSGVSTPLNLQMGRVFAGYYHAVSKETTFSEELEVRYDFTTGGRYLTTSVTALAVKLRANLAFKASETIKGDTRPVLISPANPSQGTYKQDDTLTTGALILSF